MVYKKRPGTCKVTRQALRKAYRELRGVPLEPGGDNPNEVDLSRRLSLLVEAHVRATALPGLLILPTARPWHYAIRGDDPRQDQDEVALEDLPEVIDRLIEEDAETSQEPLPEETPVQKCRPTRVCLCGSTRFAQAFQDANLRETLAGRIVLTIGCAWHSDEALGLTQEDKAMLDELHLAKIDLADEILVLNVGGYVGASTAREIAYAAAQGKRVRWLEPPSVDGQRRSS